MDKQLLEQKYKKIFFEIWEEGKSSDKLMCAVENLIEEIGQRENREDEISIQIKETLKWYGEIAESVASRFNDKTAGEYLLALLTELNLDAGGRAKKILPYIAGATSSSTVKRLEDRLFALGEMDKPPCFCCGYNGEGYYQPDKHSCAERHHKLFNNL